MIGFLTLVFYLLLLAAMLGVIYALAWMISYSLFGE